MIVHYGIDSLPVFTNAVLTIGSFDGVHVGHRSILRLLKNHAETVNGESIVISFDPHPRQVIYPQSPDIQLINTQDEKIAQIESLGIDHMVIVPFTVEFSQQDAREYIEKFLIESFSPHTVVIGYDHRFGLNRNGNFNLLKEYEEKGSFKVEEIEKKTVESITVSSTKIRNALVEGNVSDATNYLSYPYKMQGKVVYGEQLGSKLGFPTANLKLENSLKITPANGVYSVKVKVDEDEYGGMIYIGDRPSIGKDLAKTIEVNIFNFSRDIYHQEISISFLEKLRSDNKFENLEDLKAQLVIDKEHAIESIAKLAYTTEETKTAIAILNYNGEHLLDQFLSTVTYSSKDDFDLYVIDNCSTDDSINYIEEWFPEVKVIRLKKNLGFAKGYNVGLEMINAKYLVLLNSDVKVSENWLDPIIETLDNNGNIAICQPTILSLEEPEKYEYAGAAGGYMDKFGYPFCRGRLFDQVESINPEYQFDAEIFWASGAAMVIRKEVFDQVGGFDDDYFAHQEEIDLCWRVQRLRHKVKFVAESTVYHLGGGTLNYDHPKKVYLNFRNNLLTILKNEKFPRVIGIFILRLILDGLAGIKFLFSGKISAFFQVIKAHFACYIAFPKTIRKRKKFNKLSKGYKKISGRYNGSIVADYFINHKKTFETLDAKKIS